MPIDSTRENKTEKQTESENPQLLKNMQKVLQKLFAFVFKCNTIFGW